MCWVGSNSTRGLCALAGIDTSYLGSGLCRRSHKLRRQPIVLLRRPVVFLLWWVAVVLLWWVAVVLLWWVAVVLLWWAAVVLLRWAVVVLLWWVAVGRLRRFADRRMSRTRFEYRRCSRWLEVSDDH